MNLVFTIQSNGDVVINDTENGHIFVVIPQHEVRKNLNNLELSAHNARVRSDDAAYYTKCAIEAARGTELKWGDDDDWKR